MPAIVQGSVTSGSDLGRMQAMAAFLLRRVFLGLRCAVPRADRELRASGSRRITPAAPPSRDAPEGGHIQRLLDLAQRCVHRAQPLDGAAPRPVVPRSANPPPAHLLSYVAAPFGRTLLLLAVTLVIVVAHCHPARRYRRGDARLDRRRDAPHLGVRGVGGPGVPARHDPSGGIRPHPRRLGDGVVPGGRLGGECPNGHGIDLHNFQCPSGGHGLRPRRPRPLPSRPSGSSRSRSASSASTLGTCATRFSKLSTSRTSRSRAGRV